MSFTAPAKSSVNFQIPPAGNYTARLVRLIDLGTTDSEYQGQQRKRHQMFWMFELIGVMMPPNEDGEVLPFVISEFLTRSLNEKATLRHRIESWRGQGFIDDKDAEQYPIDKLLGKPCYVTVIHTKKANGDAKVSITSLIQLPEGLTAEKQINKLVMFDLANFDQGVFDELTDGIQGMIKKSDEWIDMHNSDYATTTSADTDFDDEIPF